MALLVEEFYKTMRSNAAVMMVTMFIASFAVYAVVAAILLFNYYRF